MWYSLNYVKYFLFLLKISHFCKTCCICIFSRYLSVLNIFSIKCVKWRSSKKFCLTGLKTFSSSRSSKDKVEVLSEKSANAFLSYGPQNAPEDRKTKLHWRAVRRQDSFFPKSWFMLVLYVLMHFYVFFSNKI